MDLVKEVSRKKEFSKLPRSIILRSLEKSDNDVKQARAWLRKYFGVFLTNRVLKNKGDRLESHISSKKRNYNEFYGEIFRDIGRVSSIVDLGCGLNGFSYEYLPSGVSYLGIEAAGQLVEQMNDFFAEKKFNAKAICGDLFDLDFVERNLVGSKRNRCCFLFQVVDALESVEKNFSLKLVNRIMKNCEFLVLSVPLVSLGGGKKFAVKRKWLTDFLEENYVILRDFEIFGERVFIIERA